MWYVWYRHISQTLNEFPDHRVYVIKNNFQTKDKTHLDKEYSKSKMVEYAMKSVINIMIMFFKTCLVKFDLRENF